LKYRVAPVFLAVANGSLAASQAVTAGNTFTLASFNIRLPNQ